MAFQNDIKTALILSVGLALSGAVFAGCGDDDGEETPPQQTKDGGSKPGTNDKDGGVSDGGNDGPKAGTGAGGRSGSGTGNGGRGSNQGGTGANTGAGGEGPSTCDEDDCPGAQCEPFDNAERIGHPDYVEGEALPTDFP